MRRHCYFIGAPSGSNAISLHFMALAEELAKRGHDVKMILAGQETSLQPLNRNLEILRWPSLRPTDLTAALFLSRLTVRYRPDCMIGNFAAVNWMCLIGWSCGVKCRIAYYHTLQDQLDLDAPLRTWSLRACTLRKRFVYKFATRIAAVSNSAMEDIHKSFRVPLAKCGVWPNSVPDPARQLRLQSAAEREDLIVCAGRLYPSKGQDVLLAALRLARNNLGGTRVEFLGSGTMLDTLCDLAKQQGIADRCSFVGAVPRKHVLQRMAAAKVTVVPSRREAFGLVNIESLAVGTPVIASGVDGILEIIHDGVVGCLVPPEDAKALAEKLLLVLRDAPLREKFCQNARQHFLENYESELVSARQADLLEQFLEEPGARIAKIRQNGGNS